MIVVILEKETYILGDSISGKT